MSSAQQALANFRSMTRTTSLFVRVSLWTCFILAGVFVLGTIIVGLLPDAGFGELKMSFDFRQNPSTFFAFSPTPAPEKIPLKAALIIGFVGGAPTCAWGGLLFLSISRILASILAGRPFDPRCAGHLRALALCVGLYPIVGWVSQCFVIGALQFFPELAKRMDFRFGYDFTMLVFAFLLLVLSGVFKYGAELQGDADGTV